MKWTNRHSQFRFNANQMRKWYERQRAAVYLQLTACTHTHTVRSEYWLHSNEMKWGAERQTNRTKWRNQKKKKKTEKATSPANNNNRRRKMLRANLHSHARKSAMDLDTLGIVRVIVSLISPGNEWLSLLLFKYLLYRHKNGFCFSVFCCTGCCCCCCCFRCT